MLKEQYEPKKVFTLHVRLTEACNADCSYCSTDATPDKEPFSLENFKKTCELLIQDYFSKIINTEKMGLHIQYVGGEALTVPYNELEEMVLYAREFFAPHFAYVKDGVQTNLLSSGKKVKQIMKLFNGRVGSSVDSFSDKRTYKGSAENYRKIFNNAVDRGCDGEHPASVFVVDKEGVNYAYKQYLEAKEKNYDINYFMAFQGKRNVDFCADEDEVYKEMSKIFEDWVLSDTKIRVTPIYHLLKRRVDRLRGDSSAFKQGSPCPFQHDCATSSLSIQNNGDLYLCFETSDSEVLQFGNIFEGVDWDSWDALNKRREKMNNKCKTCKYFVECQGGCLYKSYEKTGDIYGPTDFCSVWYRLYEDFDKVIKINGLDKVNSWINSI